MKAARRPRIRHLMLAAVLTALISCGTPGPYGDCQRLLVPTPDLCHYLGPEYGFVIWYYGQTAAGFSGFCEGSPVFFDPDDYPRSIECAVRYPTYARSESSTTAR